MDAKTNLRDFTRDVNVIQDKDDRRIATGCVDVIERRSMATAASARVRRTQKRCWTKKHKRVESIGFKPGDRDPLKGKVRREVRRSSKNNDRERIVFRIMCWSEIIFARIMTENQMLFFGSTSRRDFINS